MLSKKTNLILITIILLSTLGWGLLAQQPTSDGAERSKGGTFSSLSEVGDDLVALFADKSCAHFITRQSGYPLVSMACQVGYNAVDREKFLDNIFKKGFILKNESYRLSPRSGFYLYKTEYPLGTGRLVFFKLYFRHADYLWPKTPYTQGQLAVFVQGVYRMKDLLRWQTLGVPLSYGVLPFKRDTKTLGEKVREYKQELWLSLPLEPRKMSPLVGKVLTMKDSLDDEKRKTFLDEAFAAVGQVKGVNSFLGSRFTTDVYVMRSLLNDIKERNVEFFLDSITTSKSVAFETAEVMSLRAFKRDYVLPRKATPRTVSHRWNLTMNAMKTRGYGVLVVDSRSWRSFQFLKTKAKKRRLNKIHYVHVSRLPASVR